MRCRVFLWGLLVLQVVNAAKNISLSIDIPHRESPADVSYVDGKAPEELKAGPAKNITKPKEVIVQAAFIRSSNREIPKDDEIENEEFERFIQKYHSQPTIETVFVSTSPPPPAEDSEVLAEDTNIKKESQVEVFKRPSAQLRTYERIEAHPTLTSNINPTPDHQQRYSIISHNPHDASIHHGGSASFVGSDGYVFESNGGGAGIDGLILQSGGGANGGQIVLTDGHGGGGIDQQYYQYANLVPMAFNVAQNAVKTKTYEIRRPAIQKHYYDIEERVIVRPAGSIIVELDRPVAKVPTGETVVAVGGLTGTLIGNGFQQSSQGGINFGNAFGLGGGSQGFSGSGITYTTSGGSSGIGFQQSQGAIGGSQGGVGFQQSQGGIAISTTTPSPNGLPTSTVVIGTQQQQGVVGASGGGIQQSQSGIVVTTTPAPGVGGGFAGVGVQQTQSGIGISQGGISGSGFQQSQGGATFSTTTPAPGNSQTSSTTNIFVGGSNGGVSSGSFSQTQGGSGSSFGAGSSVGGVQQPQGGVYSSTGVPFYASTTPLPSGGGFSGVGIQQSQGGIGVSQSGGFSGVGIQQSQGGIGVSQGGGFSGVGIQQSQGGIGVSQGGGLSGVGIQQSQGGVGLSQGGGFSGAGFQQSQGGIGVSQGSGFSGAGFQQSQGGIYSTTPGSYLPPPSPTPTVLIGKSGGGFSGVGFQQSQGGIGLGGGYAGFQQSQGGIGISQRPGYQGGSYNGGEIIYSTTASSPSYSISGSRSFVLRPQNGGSYPVVSTTTSGPIIISTISPHGGGGNGLVVQTNSNVQSQGSVSSTTTERSFTVSRDSSYGKPTFSYPPYVEISSNGSPLGHLTQLPYTQSSGHDYPRMRYQGKLLTGEVHIDSQDGEQHETLQQGYGSPPSHHQNYENPPDSSEEEYSFKTQFTSSGHSDEQNPAHQGQLVGSSEQYTQDSQIPSSPHHQSDQIHQHHFQRTTPQPIAIPTHQTLEQQYAQQNIAHPSSSHQHSEYQHVAHHQPPQQYVVHEQRPVERPSYQSKNVHQKEYYFYPATSVQQQQPVHQNLVAQIRHQQQSPQPIYHRATDPNQRTESTHSKLQQATESIEELVEISDVHSSTHQQPTLFQQQVASTSPSLEPYHSGQRKYKKHGSPQKYTQDQSINVSPTVHTVYFNNNLEHSTARSQNLEIPSDSEAFNTKSSSKAVESSTIPFVASSSIPAQQIEATTQRQTYASVLAQSKPGILYAPPRPTVTHHSPNHKQHFLRFSADGSSLFSPAGRRVHFVYSQSPQKTHAHQSQTHSAPASPIEPVQSHISASNKEFQIQAQLPVTRQSQIHLNASSKPAPASEPQITRSQSNAASHHISANYEAVSSTTPETETVTVKKHHRHRGAQKYRNEQTHGAITLRSGRTYGDHRVIASTPAPSDGGAASESVQTRRIVVNHPFQTVQEVVEREPFTNIHQVTVNAPAKQVQLGSGLEEGQQKSAAYHAPAPYKIAASLNHPQATLSFHHGGSH